MNKPRGRSPAVPTVAARARLPHRPGLAAPQIVVTRWPPAAHRMPLRVHG